MFVFFAGNIALGKAGDTAQSSTAGVDFKKGNSVDGDLTVEQSCAGTDGPGSGSFPPSWWRLDLKSSYSVHNVTIFAREEDCCEYI